MPEVTSNSNYQFLPAAVFLGAQMLFAAFGALFPVPQLAGIDSSVVFSAAGPGTLIYQILHEGKVAVCLALLFAFIAPITCILQTWAITAPCGLPATVFICILASLIMAIRFLGPQITQRLLSPVVNGPVIMVVGLVLPQARKCLPVHRAGFWRRIHEEILPLEQGVLAARL